MYTSLYKIAQRNPTNMNSRIIKALIAKDFKETLQSKSAVLPITIVPLLFLVLVPLVFIKGPRWFDMPIESLAEKGPIKLMLEQMPETMSSQLDGLNMEQMLIVIVTCYLMAPLFLIIPLMVSSVFGANSFAGEKERKTLEALLHSPATEADLFAGKSLASVLPALAVAFIGFILYGLVVNIAAWPVMGYVFFPPLSWWVMIFWLVPAVSTLGTAIIVLISSRVKGFMEAQQMGGIMVLPFLGLLAAQLTGVLYLDYIVTLLLGLAVWVLNGLLLWFGARSFSRSRLITQL